MLRNLIVRRSAAEFTESTPRFDLAAFDDLLMLYNVAQTTPASSRGQLPGRVRTAPTEVPLPEISFDSSSEPVSSIPHTAAVPGTPPAPLPLHKAHLDMLRAAPAQAPLAPSTPLDDSPFKSALRLPPDEMLIDGLSLDWENALNPVTTPPADTKTAPSNQEDELIAFTMDERDLPTSSKS